MIINLQSKVLSSDNCLTVFYHTNEERKTKLDHFSLDGRISTFARSAVWINEQPSTDLKGFKSLIMQQDTLVDSYHVANEELHLFLNLQNEICLKIVRDSNNEIAFLQIVKENNDNNNDYLKVNPQLKMSGLKKMLERKCNLKDFYISYKGSSPLTTPKITDCSIEENTRFDVRKYLDKQTNNHIGSALESCTKKIRFANFENKIQIIFGEAPKWREISDGFNIEGECQNQLCKDAYGMKVYDKKGFGTFQISKLRVTASCPMCEKPLKNVINCVFYNCMYAIEAEREGGKPFKEKEQIAPGDSAISFAEELADDPQGNIVDWKQIKVITTSIEEPITSSIENTSTSPYSTPKCMII